MTLKSRSIVELMTCFVVWRYRHKQAGSSTLQVL